MLDTGETPLSPAFILKPRHEGKPTLAFGSDVWWHEPAFNESNTAMDVQPSVKYDWSKFENVVMTPHFGPSGGLIFKPLVI